MDESPALTPEVLNAAFKAIQKQGSMSRHDCRFDGHVACFMTTRCTTAARRSARHAGRESPSLGEFDSRKTAA